MLNSEMLDAIEKGAEMGDGITSGCALMLINELRTLQQQNKQMKKAVQSLDDRVTKRANLFAEKGQLSMAHEFDAISDQLEQILQSIQGG
jgi:hypothetical protein